eukprot:snap_masked-scaffold_24-processed-gene-2.56-mRNA-1 protein AED:1.00 eAED:1.00 QI:0/0/0/0/1/1/2/0/68
MDNNESQGSTNWNKEGTTNGTTSWLIINLKHQQRYVMHLSFCNIALYFIFICSYISLHAISYIVDKYM